VGAELRAGAEVVAIDADDRGAEVVLESGERIRCDHVLAGVAPHVLAELLGEPAPGPAPRGAQLKVNLLLRELPRDRDFRGTVHVDSSYTQLAAAAASAEPLPDPLPFDVYCHSLTDPSILGPDLRAAGAQTLTAFALHVGAGADGAEGARRVVAALGCEELLWEAPDGTPCVEWRTQEDVEAELAMPGGHIFHRDPSWPFSEEGGGWGVETGRASVLLCGAGALRGGGVSAIPGRNAALAALSNRT
jgi:phytoene dehydrogenase-like protein